MNVYVEDLTQDVISCSLQCSGAAEPAAKEVPKVLRGATRHGVQAVRHNGLRAQPPQTNKCEQDVPSCACYCNSGHGAT